MFRPVRLIFNYESKKFNSWHVPILIVILLFGCSRLFWNTMYVVLLISKDNLLARNQSPNMFRSILMFVYNCVRFELVW